MRGLKAVSLVVVLLSAVLCVASVGVTESWWSDTDDTTIEIGTADLFVEVGDQSWDGKGQLSLNAGTYDLRSNYSVTLEFTGGTVECDSSIGSSLKMTAGTVYSIKVTGGTIVTLGGGGS